MDGHLSRRTNGTRAPRNASRRVAQLAELLVCCSYLLAVGSWLLRRAAGGDTSGLVESEHRSTAAALNHAAGGHSSAPLRRSCATRKCNALASLSLVDIAQER